ncbi:MAG: phosphoglucosamine mutase [Pseudomonadota bacterium]
MQDGKKYFGTDGIRASYGQYPISPLGMLDIARAVAQTIPSSLKNMPTCVVGRDPRASGTTLALSFCSGLCAQGVHVIDVGMLPTPAIALLTRLLQADLGAVISASHNPAADNGIKFFTSSGYKISKDREQAIEAALKQPAVASGAQFGAYREHADADAQYQTYCQQRFGVASMNGLKVVLDCAHGAMSYIAPAVYKSLGAELTVVGAEPTGLNINEQCGATDLNLLSHTVCLVGADIGFAFDGDGDRLMAVDHLGQVHDGDDLLFVLASARIAKGELLNGVVGTEFTNLGLSKALGRQQVPFFAAPVGDREVVECMQAKGLTLGGESSGHLVDLLEMTTGDGLLSSLLIVRALKQLKLSLAQACAAMPRFASRQLNIPCLPEQMAYLVQHLKETTASLQAFEGQVRIVIRPSGTEPVVRVRIESLDLEIISKLSELIQGAAQQAMAAI